jgi:hypothetical protein
VTLAVTGNTTSGQVIWLQRMQLIQRHRMPLTGSRWNIRWVIGRRTNPTFCVFPVFSKAVMEKCFDACGDVDYYFRSGFSVSEGAGVLGVSIAVDRKSMGHTVADRSSNEADFLCVFLYLACRLWQSVVTLAVTDSTVLRSGFSASKGFGVSGTSTAVYRESMGHTMAARSSNEADFLCIFCIRRGVCGIVLCRLRRRRKRLPVRSFIVRGCRCFRGIDCR